MLPVTSYQLPKAVTSWLFAILLISLSFNTLSPFLFPKTSKAPDPSKGDEFYRSGSDLLTTERQQGQWLGVQIRSQPDSTSCTVSDTRVAAFCPAARVELCSPGRW